MDQWERYIAWIDSQISETKTYHNHKETTAWIATAFYWTSIVVLGGQVPDSLGVIARVLLLKIIFFATVAVGVFVYLQLNRRKKSAIEVQELMQLKRDLLTEPRPEDFPEDFINRFKEITELDSKPSFPKLFSVSSYWILFTGFLVASILFLAPIMKYLIICLVHICIL